MSGTNPLGIESNPLTVWSGREAVPSADRLLTRGRSYELLAGGPRATAFLTEVELPEDELRADELVGPPAGGSVADGDDPDLPDGGTTGWSLAYRVVAETAPEEVAPFAIYFVGVNPPRGATSDEMEAFNDFYTSVHMPEVASRRQCLRAVRYELHPSQLPFHRDRPMFLAVYAVDEQGAARRRHIGGPYARGPAVWQKHTTPWRLWYRRLPA